MNLFTRRSLSVLALIVLISAAGIYALQYRRYGYATAWHCRHGASIRFGGHEIQIPGLWWAAKTDNAGRISILRASKSSVFYEPRIVVSSATPGQVAENDDEQLRLASRVVAIKSRDPQSGWSHSVASIRATSSTWSCIRDDEAVLGSHVLTILTCNTPRVRCTLHYHGPPEQEQEAEGIFATFQ
jgi:hypothetical protein